MLSSMQARTRSFEKRHLYVEGTGEVRTLRTGKWTLKFETQS